jgi:hypothetical protein
MSTTEDSKGELLPAKHISIFVRRSADDVYRFASQPENLPKWAAGLGGSIEREGDKWMATSGPLGWLEVRMAPKNDFRVLDHDVVVGSGETFHNPMRVLPNGEGSEVVFTLFHREGVTVEELERDAEAVGRDLTTLKGLLEPR